MAKEKPSAALQTMGRAENDASQIVPAGLDPSRQALKTWPSRHTAPIVSPVRSSVACWYPFAV